MSTPIVVATFYPKPETKTALIDALRATVPAVHRETGCLLYAVHDAEDGTLVMIEKWATQASLDAHASGAAAAIMREQTAPLLSKPTVVNAMHALPFGDSSQSEL